MSILIAGWASAPLFLLILVITAREVTRFRRDQQTRSELYPYTRRRLLVRSLVSFCLLAIVFLLFWGPFLFRPMKAEWFVAYVGSILFATILMVFLAWLDWRESRFLEKVSQKRLLAELIQDIKQGAQTPDIH